MKPATSRARERLLRRLGFQWVNGFQRKLDGVLSGASVRVYRYHAVSALLGLAGRLGLGRVISRTAPKLGIYPSMIYLARKAGEY